jgi:hypothetical protein
MDYRDAGYDQFFQKTLLALDPTGAQNTTAFDAASQIQNLPAEKLAGGTFSSKEGNITMSLDDGFISFKSNGVERVRLGNSPDIVGASLIIRDGLGNILMQISDDKNIIQSPSTNLQLDFNEERILVLDNGLPRVLIGKGDF